MCAEGFVLVADNTVPPILDGTTDLADAEASLYRDVALKGAALSTVDEETSFVERTVTICDWDDTLLSSSFLAASSFQVDDPTELPKQLQGMLEDLETLVIALLRDAMALGHVCIITNAETGWVELSGGRYLPGVLNFVNKHNISIVSARSAYEASFPESPEDWKIQAFATEVSDMFPDMDELNILVLGDSVSELQAAHELARNNPRSRVKAVAFQERPSVEQLQRQISAVLSTFKELVEYDGSCCLRLNC